MSASAVDELINVVVTLMALGIGYWLGLVEGRGK